MLIPIKETDRKSIERLKEMVVALHFLMKITEQEYNTLYDFLERLEKTLD